MLRGILWPVVCFAFCMAGAAQQKAEPSKRAVLIVNSDYQKLPRLTSPPLDRVALEEALKKTGFEVTTFPNNLTTADQFDEEFQKNVQAGDIVLLFYAGYAVQSKSDNFLLPVNFDPASTDPLVNTAISLIRLQDDLSDQKASIRIVLLDAAHDERALDRIGVGPGLRAPDQSGSEICFLFSAPLNQVAPAAPAGSAGALASAFAKAIVEPDSSLLRTISEVVSALGNQPFFSPQVTQAFYFMPPPPALPIARTPVRDNYRNPIDKSDYVFVPGGTFQAGCRAYDPECGRDEPRQHQVTLPESGFWIGQTEVTVKAYRLFVDATKRKMPSASDDNRKWEFTDHPMIKASWREARGYCEWIGGRLPTGDEWERAARGGTDTRYPWGDRIQPNQAKYIKAPGKTGAVTAPVKSFEPNGYGLYDVAGNVWEWTTDVGEKGVHQTRGGSWFSAAKDLHVTSVRTFKSDEGVNEVGFRCLLPQLPQTAPAGN